MQVCTSFQTDNHSSTPPLSLLQAGCPSCCPTYSVKVLRACWNVLVICCCRISLGVSCPYGERCSQAHSKAELEEWKEYFEDRRARLEIETRNEDCQFAEQLLEKWMNAENPETVVSCCAFLVILFLAVIFCGWHICNIHYMHSIWVSVSEWARGFFSALSLRTPNALDALVSHEQVRFQ